MEIAYINTRKDMMSFSVFHHLRSRVQQVSLLLCIAILAFVVWRSASLAHATPATKAGIVLIMEILFLIAWAVVTLLSFFFSLSPRKNKGVLTEHRIQLSETNLVEETNVNRSSHLWSGIANVCQNQDYIFIYASQHGAYVIPKNAFQSKNDETEFFQYAYHHWSLANGSRLPAHGGQE